MDLFEKFIDKSREVLAIHSVQDTPMPDAPFGVGVRECLDTTLQCAQSLGFTITDGGGYYGYAEIGEGKGLFAMLGHLDTVPLGSDWDVPPLDARIVDGVLYGRGVMDDKVPILACLYAAAELIQEGKVPNQRIRIVFGCNEESGWECMEHYTQHEELPSIGFTPDSDFPVINCEKGVAHYAITLPMPSGVIAINGGERVNMVMDRCTCVIADCVDFNNAVRYANEHGIAIDVDGNAITAHGVSAHGSTPDKGVNALFIILNILAAVIGNEWQNLRDQLCTTDGATLGIAVRDDVSGALSINIGTINTNSNGVTLNADVRYPISADKLAILDKLKSALLNSQIVVDFEHLPLYVEQDNPLVVALCEAYNSVTGDNAAPLAIGGATYARAMPNIVAFGPLFPEAESTIHQKNERASLADLRRMYDIYKVAIAKIGFN